MSKNIPAPLNLEAGRSLEDDRVLQHYYEAASRRKGGSELRNLAYLGAIVKEAGVGDILIALDLKNGPDLAISCISKIKTVVQESLDESSIETQDNLKQVLERTVVAHSENPFGTKSI